ncbi:MAG TPA: hypothetical protein VFP44_15655 [Usitatibacter sp.]|nr:hypothetical protein [Usitatibacter sp.]
MAAFCAFSWWWLVPLAFFLLFAVACAVMLARGGCPPMCHRHDRP